MKRKSYPVTNIGSVSLLMVFIVLCLVTFATLSLSSAAGDYKYSQNTAQHNTEYYNACNQASLRLKKIDNILSEAYQNNAADYYSEVSDQFTSMENVTADFTTDTPSISFEIKINKTKALKVVLTLNSPDKLFDGFYNISSWQEVSTADWKSNEHLNLFE